MRTSVENPKHIRLKKKLEIAGLSKVSFFAGHVEKTQLKPAGFSKKNVSVESPG